MGVGRNHPVTNTVGSLREWRVLHSVRCTLAILLGTGHQEASPRQLADVLPPSVCELEILRDSYWPTARVVHEILALLGKKEELVPGLMRVGVHIPGGKSPKLLDTLKAACKAVDVELVEDRERWFHTMSLYKPISP